jgi:hypothetical protein
VYKAYLEAILYADTCALNQSLPERYCGDNACAKGSLD